MRRSVLLLSLTACVTKAPADDLAVFPAAFAPPTVSVRLAETVVIPERYDDSLSVVPGAPEGAAAAFVTERIETALAARLASSYKGEAAVHVDLVVERAMLPDQLPALGLAGARSLSVRFTLTGEGGTVLAETVRPFVILPDFERRFSLLGFWRARNWYDDSREDALVALAEETARVVGAALSGEETQTGLAGQLAAYPERISHPR
jgi:hypothetical protein